MGILDPAFLAELKLVQAVFLPQFAQAVAKSDTNISGTGHGLIIVC